MLSTIFSFNHFSDVCECNLLLKIYPRQEPVAHHHGITKTIFIIVRFNIKGCEH